MLDFSGSTTANRGTADEGLAGVQLARFARLHTKEGSEFSCLPRDLLNPDGTGRCGRGEGVVQRICCASHIKISSTGLSRLWNSFKSVGPARLLCEVLMAQHSLFLRHEVDMRAHPHKLPLVCLFRVSLHARARWYSDH